MRGEDPPNPPPPRCHCGFQYPSLMITSSSSWSRPLALATGRAAGSMPVTRDEPAPHWHQLPSQPHGHWHGHWHSRQLEHRGTMPVAPHGHCTPVTVTQAGTANLNTEALRLPVQPLPVGHGLPRMAPHGHGHWHSQLERDTVALHRDSVAQPTRT